MAAECLVLLYVNIIPEAVGAGKVVLCPCVVDRRIEIIIDIHPRFPLNPASVVSVHAGCEGNPEELSLSLYSVNNRIAPAFLNRVLLPV